MKRISIHVKAIWDEDAKVWVAQSEDIRGLATEASTVEELREKVLQMMQELLAMNGHPDLDMSLPEIPVHFMAEHCVRVANPSHS